MIARFLPKTMRARLALSFAASTSIILALSGIALYELLSASIARTFEHEMKVSLVGTVSRLAPLRSLSEVRAQNPATHWPRGADDDLRIAVLGPDGTVLARSGTFVVDPNVLAARPGETPLFVGNDMHGWRSLVVGARIADTAAPPLRVVVQRNYRGAHAFLRACAVCVALGVLGGTFLAAMLALRIASFALKPLARLAARADEISSSRLAHAMPTDDMPGELRELSLAFNRMLARLDQSFTQLAQFSSDLAHDIRTPLTNLLAQAQVALSQDRANGEYRAVIESSIEEFQRLSRMVDDMLFLARADARQRKAQFRLVDGHTEARRVAGYYEPMADDLGITISVVGQSSFEGDPLLVQRALSNLLSNALAHAPTGSTVTITCRNEAAYARLSVTDCGPGIGSQHLARIFDRFYRADPARHNSAAGTGLGLAIVKSIMDEHDGECSVESVPNMQTTFSLRFPRRVQ